MPNYAGSVVYKLCCTDPRITEIYVGSTTNFSKRKQTHKLRCYGTGAEEKKMHYPVYEFIRNNGHWANWDMIQLEQYKAKDKRDLEKRERYWMDLLKPVLNQIIPYRTPEENKEYNRLIALEKSQERSQQLKDEGLKKCELCKCEVYDMELHKKSKFHILRENGEMKPKEEEGDECPVNDCKAKVERLRPHLINVHGWTSDQVTDFQEDRKERKSKLYDCDICGIGVTRFTDHLIKAHGKTREEATEHSKQVNNERIKCDKCDKMITRRLMNNHIKKIHDTEIPASQRYAKTYYDKHVDKLKEKRKQYYEENKDKEKEYRDTHKRTAQQYKEYHDKNRDKINARRRAWYDKNKTEINKKRAEKK